MFPTANSVSDNVDFSTFKGLTNTYIVVTTQGEDDELSVKKALETAVGYVGFVASAKKSEDIKAYLAKEGIAEARIDQLRSPVGLDINAKLASEVAISILAEVIDDFRKENKTKAAGSCCGSTKVSEASEETTPAEDKFAQDYYINPVCNVPVSKKNPKHIIEYRGEKVYFCCDGCKVSFENEPSKYIKA